MNSATLQTGQTEAEVEIGTGEAPPPHWVSRAAFPLITACFFTTELLMGFAVYKGWYWAAIPLALIISHFMHGQLIGFHEASHGMLRKNRVLNEIDGIIIGSFSLLCFSLFRAVHQSHHAHLATERDEELWPFVVTRMSRGRRMLAAFLELNVGILFTPFLFYRSFLRPGSPIRNKKLRRRIWKELVLLVVIWSLALGAVAWFGVWKYFLWMHLIPAVIAANMQSWRKYIEHMGMLGSTVNSSTRNIVSEGLMGKVVAVTLLHEPFHGVHHRFSGIPHSELPSHTDELVPKRAEELPPFPSYRHAMGHLLRQLANPRVGAQWRSS